MSSHVQQPKGNHSAAFLAAIVDSSNDAIISKDLNGVITSWNASAERLFGYTAAEAIGQPVTMLFPPERLKEEVMILDRIKRGERVEHFETIRRHKSGTRLDVGLTISPIRDETGKIIGASKIAHDLRHERQAEERFRVTLSSIGDAVISTDVAGRIVFMNAVAEKLTGWEERTAIGRPLEEVFVIVNETTRLHVPSLVAEVLRTGTVIGLANHTILIARDGAERPIDDSAAPIRDTAGGLVGVVLVFRDVSERRRAELAAIRLAAIVDGSTDAIVGKNLQGIVTNWNPAAQRIFGYTPEEMIGTSITRLIPPDRLEEEQHILSRIQRGERVEAFQTIRVRKDGRPIDVAVTISPIKDGEGVIVGASKIARDITAEKAATEALAKAQHQLTAHASDLDRTVHERTAKLEEVVAELEAFSYSLSHDLRAPLRAIHGFTEIALEDFGDKAPEASEYLRKVIRAAARMERLISDVLTFARVSRQDLALAPVDLDSLMPEVLAGRPEFQRPQAEITIDGPLAPVVGHEPSLTQCLSNLLGNAVKFVVPGATPQVRVYTQKRGDRVQVRVQDNGIGINPESQRRLFILFERLATKHHYEGTGVGLAIVRKAAERMGGSVGVESTPGQGSTFWVELPAA